MKNDFKKKLVCPYDHGKLTSDTSQYFLCTKCERIYPMQKNGIINFLPDSLRTQVIEESTQSNTSPKINTGKWRPGLRHWRPGFLANLIRIGVGGGRLEDGEDGMSMLDVGCGGNAQGDVNTDIYVPNPIPKNFILASAELLPFEDLSFDIVRSAYVIEHNLFPSEMIKEHYRVGRKKIIIYTDNSDWIGAIILRMLNTGYIFHDEHYFKWSKEYFSNLIDRLGFNGQVCVFNSSPSYIVKIIALMGRIPRIGPIFYRDLSVTIDK